MQNVKYEVPNRQTCPASKPQVMSLGVCFLVLGFACLACLGCATNYQLRGKVIEGSAAQVLIIDKDDPRYLKPNASGAGASVQVMFEPRNRISRESLGQFATDNQGRFAIPIDAFGAGRLQYEVELIARQDAHQGVLKVFRVPGRSKRVLVILPRGIDTLEHQEHITDQTLREAQPYLDGRR